MRWWSECYSMHIYTWHLTEHPRSQKSPTLVVQNYTFSSAQIRYMMHLYMFENIQGKRLHLHRKTSLSSAYRLTRLTRVRTAASDWRKTIPMTGISNTVLSTGSDLIIPPNDVRKRTLWRFQKLQIENASCAYRRGKVAWALYFLDLGNPYLTRGDAEACSKDIRDRNAGIRLRGVI
jgi:hypothetical protein